jgi:hypothetical protein
MQDLILGCKIESKKMLSDYKLEKIYALNFQNLTEFHFSIGEGSLVTIWRSD